MKHIRIITFTAVLFSIRVLAQGQATEGSAMVDKANRNVFMITIDQPVNVTQDALQIRLDRAGLKDKPKNGVMNFKGVVLSDLSPDKIDLYTTVTNGANNSSIITIAISKGYNNFISSATDSATAQNTKNFLQSLILNANNRSADVGINNQIQDINKDQKAYQKLLDEQSELQKKKAGIENRLAEIQTELDGKMTMINKKKADLDDAKTKRSSAVTQ